MAVPSPVTMGAYICVTFFMTWADLHVSALHTEGERSQDPSSGIEPKWKDDDQSRGFLPSVDHRVSDGSGVLSNALKSIAALSLMLAPSGNAVPGMSVRSKRNATGILSRMFGARMPSTKKRFSPFTRGRPQIVLDAGMKMVLASGRTWSSTKVDGKLGIATGILHIKAPPAVVWRQLLDLPAYVQKVPVVVKSEVYKRSSSWGFGGVTETICIRQVSQPFPGVRLVSYQEQVYEPGKSSMTFSLDESKKSDFQEMHGHWHVEKHWWNPSKCRLFFELAILAPRWLPDWIIKQISLRGVRDLTGWVKKYSEKEASSLSG